MSSRYWKKPTWFNEAAIKHMDNREQTIIFIMDLFFLVCFLMNSRIKKTIMLIRTLGNSDFKRKLFSISLEVLSIGVLKVKMIDFMSILPKTLIAQLAEKQAVIPTNNRMDSTTIENIYRPL